jgi:hypothetical protein
MSRRSRTNRKKARASEAPPRASTPAPGSNDVTQELSTESAASPPLDEMAAVDAGWDEVGP